MPCTLHRLNWKLPFVLVESNSEECDAAVVLHGQRLNPFLETPRFCQGDIGIVVDMELLELFATGIAAVHSEKKIDRDDAIVDKRSVALPLQKFYSCRIPGISEHALHVARHDMMVYRLIRFKIDNGD